MSINKKESKTKKAIEGILTLAGENSIKGLKPRRPLLALACAFNMSEWGVRLWIKRGKIPDRHWPVIAKMAGVEMDRLWEAHQ